MRNVVVVIGVGGIGIAIARRQGLAKTLLLADYDERTLGAAAANLKELGYHVVTQTVDVSHRESVRALADAAAGLGRVEQVVHTAGLSPNMASHDRILAVDLLGTALVIDEFERVIVPGGAGLVISSMAGYMPPPLGKEIDDALARTPADQLLQLPAVKAVADSGAAYGLSKRANHLRIQYECLRWGQRGARLNSISPGIIATPMAQKEMSSPVGPIYNAMIEASATKRIGTPEDIACAAAYLLGPDASFVTGSDLLIDGGVIAAMRADQLEIPGV